MREQFELHPPSGSGRPATGGGPKPDGAPSPQVQTRGDVGIRRIPVMRAIGLCYHDVDEIQGPPRGTRHPSELYCLPFSRFQAHMNAIQAQAGQDAVCGSAEFTAWPGPRPVFLTFDDGGRGAIDLVAPELEARGWRGFFFITTDWIGLPGYLTAGEIRELHRRGHVIGSHSCTHPERMSSLTSHQLEAEWRGSCDRLADLTGQSTRTASVPGGYHSRRVAVSAAAAGIEMLFTSEPRTRVGRQDGCLVVGRYSIQRSTQSSVAGRIASGCLGPRLRQAAAWNLRKAVKTIAGPQYLALRQMLLSLHESGTPGASSDKRSS